MLSKQFIPQKPFDGFKWKWASVAPTEGINDPVVLLGVLFKLNELSKLGVKFSSPEYQVAMQDLEKDLQSANISVKVTARTGERNLFRNSGQYWKAVGLIPNSKSGIITLTDFGKAVAERKISKTEFSAITIRTLKLPNERIQSEDECALWTKYGINIYPLKIILSTLHILSDLEIDNKNQGWITADELIRIIIPLSACNAEAEDYANFIYWYRTNQINIDKWPDCATMSNDRRMAREFLLFLQNYGYLTVAETKDTNYFQKFIYNSDLDEEIVRIINSSDDDKLLTTTASQNLDRKRYNQKHTRPLQGKFRQDLLTVSDKCVITRVRMVGLLEAAHIKPHKYNGPEDKSNGILLRRDMHYLFDSGNLRINVNGDIFITQPTLEDYGRSIPEHIDIPEYVNREYLKWRWENYDGE